MYRACYEGVGVGGVQEGAPGEVRDAVVKEAAGAVELLRIRQGQRSYTCSHTITRSKL